MGRCARLVSRRFGLSYRLLRKYIELQRRVVLDSVMLDSEHVFSRGLMGRRIREREVATKRMRIEWRIVATGTTVGSSTNPPGASAVFFFLTDLAVVAHLNSETSFPKTHIA